MQLYTLDETAEMMKCSRRTVERLIESGRLAVVAVGERGVRVSEEDLNNYVRDNRRLY